MTCLGAPVKVGGADRVKINMDVLFRACQLFPHMREIN